MSEQLSGGPPSLYDLVMDMFQSTYAPDSNINIRNILAVEAIEGKQRNGCRILLCRPVIEVDREIAELELELVFRVIVGFNSIASPDGEIRPYERSYIFGQSDLDHAFEAIETNPLVTIPVGPGEMDDLRHKIETSDFSVPA